MKLNLNTKQAAEYLESKGTPFSYKTLEAWRSRGYGPKYKKIVGKIFYDKCALDEFQEGRTVEPSESRSEIAAFPSHED